MCSMYSGGVAGEGRGGGGQQKQQLLTLCAAWLDKCAIDRHGEVEAFAV